MRNLSKSTTRTLLAGASLLVGFLATTARADYSNTVAGYNPLAYWRFNEATASPALNKVANSGTVGSAGDGYVVLGAIKGQAGKVGNAIRFTNPGKVTGYCGSRVDVPHTAALNPTAPFSVEFWHCPNLLGTDLGGTDPGCCPLTSLNGNWTGGSSRQGWLFYMNTVGRWNVRLGLASGTYAVNFLNTNGLGNAQIGIWQHMVMTFDGATCYLYANGVRIGEGPLQLPGWVPNAQTGIRFGGTEVTGTLADGPWVTGAAPGGNRGYDGWLDEVAIYSNVLSAATVAAHYAAAATPATYPTTILADQPLGYWRMEEPAVVTPSPSTFPIAANSGSLGSAVDGTNMWGVLAAQSGPAYAGFGAGNKACLFDGFNGYFAMPDDAGLHFSGQVTMMAWVKPRVKDYYRSIIAHGWDDNYQETFLRISHGDAGDGDGVTGVNYYELGVTDGGNNTYYDVTRFPMPEGDIGNWVFVAGTYNGSSWNLYRNGVLVSSVASANGLLDVAGRWGIGSRRGPPSPTSFFTADLNEVFAASGAFFGGSMDEPAIFNTALSASAINTIYNAAQVPPVITRAVQNPGIVFEGAPVSFDVWAEGSPTLGQYWTSNGIYAGVTATNWAVNSFSTGTKTIAVIVTNVYGSATSSVTFSVIAAPPSIVTQPKDTTRFVGYPFSLTLSAGGSTPLTYYWSNTTSGVLVQSGPSPTYSAVASFASQGAYKCLVSNAVGTLWSAPAVLTVNPIPAGYAGDVLASGPVAYWRLGEASGSVAHDGVSGYDGKYFAATLAQPGYSAIDSDTAASFGAVNSYVGEIPGTPGAGVNFSGVVNFTIELWAKGPSGQADESTLIAKGNGQDGTTGNEQFAIDVSGGKYRFFTRGGGNVFYEADATVGPNGAWQHIVGVYDLQNTLGGGALMYIFVNGELLGTGTPRSTVRTSSVEVDIGAKHLGNDPAFDGYFTGQIDEVAVYPFAMSAATVLAHYSAAYGPSLAPVIDIQPQSVTNYIGLPVTLSVAAHGTVPLSYQWKKGGVDLGPPTTSYTYTIPAVGPGDVGYYTVGVSNGINPGQLSTAAYVAALPTPTSPPAIPGLVLHMPFDNNVNDTSGHANHGAGIRRIQNAGVITSNVVAQSYVAGKLGSGLHFASTPLDSTGTNFDNYYVSLGERPDFQFADNVNFTVAFWVKNTDGPYGAVWFDLPFLCSVAGSTFSSPGLVLAYTYGIPPEDYIGGWAYSIYGSDGGVGGRGDEGAIDDGTWRHLAYVFDRVAGATVYTNGVPAAFNKQSGTAAYNAGDINNPGAWLTIGQDPSGAYWPDTTWTASSASGAMDDLGIWRKALTPLEVASLYTAGINNLSFTSVPDSFYAVWYGGSLKIYWNVGVLQSSTTVNGTYTDVPGATSPYTVPLAGAKAFFKVRK